MKLLQTLIAFLVLACNVFSQYHAIEIPEMKNLDRSDKYPERSMLATYTNNFDLLISLKNYSAWGPDDHIKVLAHHKGGWYRIEINTDHKNFGTFDATCLLLFKIDNAIGDSLFSVLKDNHLFDMMDERNGKFSGFEPATDTSIVKGKKQISYTLCDISDGPEYEFELITAKNYKQIYFYSPQYRYRCYPKYSEMKWIINCITAFEKYLGN